MTMLQNALTAEHVILSSAGAHAGQGWQQIIARKQADIASTNHSVWVVNSQAALPKAVQFCGDHDARFVIFVSRLRPNSNSQSASGTSTSDRARDYSRDGGKTWSLLDKGLSPVTGKINNATTGFWFDALEQINSGQIDLGSFSKLDGQILDRFHLHQSAYPVRRLGAVRRAGYEVLAVGKLAAPFAVWLRK